MNRHGFLNVQRSTAVTFLNTQSKNNSSHLVIIITTGQHNPRQKYKKKSARTIPLFLCDTAKCLYERNDDLKENLLIYNIVSWYFIVFKDLFKYFLFLYINFPFNFLYLW